MGMSSCSALIKASHVTDTITTANPQPVNLLHTNSEAFDGSVLQREVDRCDHQQGSTAAQSLVQPAKQLLRSLSVVLERQCSVGCCQPDCEACKEAMYVLEHITQVHSPQHRFSICFHEHIRRALEAPVAAGLRESRDRQHQQQAELQQQREQTNTSLKALKQGKAHNQGAVSAVPDAATAIMHTAKDNHTISNQIETGVDQSSCSNNCNNTAPAPALCTAQQDPQDVAPKNPAAPGCLYASAPLYVQPATEQEAQLTPFETLQSTKSFLIPPTTVQLESSARRSYRHGTAPTERFRSMSMGAYHRGNPAPKHYLRTGSLGVLQRNDSARLVSGSSIYHTCDSFNLLSLPMTRQDSFDRACSSSEDINGHDLQSGSDGYHTFCLVALDDQLRDAPEGPGKMDHVMRQIDNVMQSAPDANSIATRTKDVAQQAQEFVEHFSIGHWVGLLFQCMDRDGNGVVSSEECMDFLLDTVQFDDVTCMNLFHLVDDDCNGVIDKEECATLLYLLTRRHCQSCYRIITHPEFFSCSSCDAEDMGGCTAVCPECYAEEPQCNVDGHQHSMLKTLSNFTDFCSRVSPAAAIQHMVARYKETATPDQPATPQVRTPLATKFARTTAGIVDDAAIGDKLGIAVVQCFCCGEMHDDVDGYLHGTEKMRHVQHIRDGRYVCEFCAKKMCVRCGKVKWCTKPRTCRSGRWLQYHKCSSKCDTAPQRDEPARHTFDQEATCAMSGDSARSQCRTCQKKLAMGLASQQCDDEDGHNAIVTAEYEQQLWQSLGTAPRIVPRRYCIIM